MRFTVLGSCSGTEAMPERRHTSVMLEAGGRHYLFDAGDSCGYTAHLLGFDVTEIKAVFISHPHIDHIGGLPYLLFEIAKMKWRRNITDYVPLRVYCADEKSVNAAVTLCRGDAVRPKYMPVTDGVIFDDGVLRVTALHNTHMRETAAPWNSFSFIIECEGKRVVYSGDIGKREELDALSDCDLMFLENGHFTPPDTAGYLMGLEKRPPRLVYFHHGRSVLERYDETLREALDVYDGELSFAYDKMTVEV